MTNTDFQSESKENTRGPKSGIEEEIMQVFQRGVREYLDEKLPKRTIKDTSMEAMGKWSEKYLAPRGLEWSPWMRSYVENSAALTDVVARSIDVPLAKVPFLPEKPAQRLFASMAQRGPLDKLDGFLFRNYPWIIGTQKKL